MVDDFARELRKNMTDAERRLWSQIGHRQIAGARFPRQARIENYIVDLICFERKVIVELDGGQHAVQVEKDAVRTAWLNSRRFQVLRFWNHQIFEELESVLEAIGIALTTPHPSPPPQGGRGPERASASRDALP